MSETLSPAATLTITCACGKEIKARPAKGGGLKTPKRWKKVGDDVFRCPDCTKGSFLARSIRLSIVDVVSPETRTKAEMYSALVSASSDLARFANWYVQRLFVTDPALAWRHPAKFPALPTYDYYQEARAQFTAIAPTGLCQAAQQIRAWYASDRFEVFGRLKRSVRSYKWDELPVVVHGQSWKIIGIDADGVIVRVAIGPGGSWHVRCKTDGDNLTRLRQLVAGKAESGTAMLCRRRRAKRPGESQPPPHVWQLRISALVPKPKRRAATKTALLRHDPNVLLVLTCGDELLEVPAVRLRERVIKHRLKDWREQQDQSEQHRLLSRRARKRLGARRRLKCDKNVRYVGKEIELAAAIVARWCVSHGVSNVDYDQTDRNWIDGFPYYALCARITCALENEGIGLKTTGLAGPMDDTEGQA